MIINKDHFNEDGINRALLLKSNMNSKRTNYNWDHLFQLDNY
jgi:hypothetical protein